MAGGQGGPEQLASQYQQTTQGLQGLTGLSGSMATGGFDPSQGIGSYMNPYTQGVINPAMAEIGHQQGLAQNQLASDAQKAGAYGGDRFGIQSAENQRNFDQQRAQTISQLYNQGYQNATGAYQNQMGQGMQGLTAGLGGLQTQTGQGWDISQDILRNQMGVGQLQQQLQQGLIDAAKGQYSGYVNAPKSGLEVLLKSISAMPGGIGTQTGTSQQNKGSGAALGSALQVPMMFKILFMTILTSEIVAYVLQTSVV